MELCLGYLLCAFCFCGPDNLDKPSLEPSGFPPQVAMARAVFDKGTLLLEIKSATIFPFERVEENKERKLCFSIGTVTESVLVKGSAKPVESEDAHPIVNEVELVQKNGKRVPAGDVQKLFSK